MSERTIEITEPVRANVSVIITCYNLEKYLGEAVESVKAQTVCPQEIIVVHDGCDKPTMHDGTHTVFRQVNLGVAKTRDEGVRIASQPNLLFLDADDVIPETYLQEMVSTLQQGADIAYPDILMWSRWGESGFPNVWHGVRKNLTLKSLLRMNEVVVSSLMKRKVYDKIGGFDPTMRVFEDWDFWIRAMVRGFRFAKANTFLKYRQRTGGRNRQSDDLKRQVHREVNARYARFLPGAHKERRPSHLEKR